LNFARIQFEIFEFIVSSTFGTPELSILACFPLIYSCLIAPMSSPVTVLRLPGQTVKNLSGSGRPCRHKRVVPHPSATYVKGPRPQALCTRKLFTDP
jgi:hypothetical protein